MLSDSLMWVYYHARPLVALLVALALSGLGIARYSDQKLRELDNGVRRDIRPS